VRLSVVGAQPDCPSQSRNRCVDASEGEKREARVPVVRSAHRLGCACAIDELERGDRTPFLMGEKAEQVKRVGMVRDRREYAPVMLVCLGTPPRPVKLEAAFEKLADVGFTHGVNVASDAGRTQRASGFGASASQRSTRRR
jgi:hypothetical protein